MADTGEDREIKQRTNAHQVEVVRESKKLVQKAKQPSARNKPRSRGTSHPRTKSRGLSSKVQVERAALAGPNVLARSA